MLLKWMKTNTVAASTDVTVKLAVGEPMNGIMPRRLHVNTKRNAVHR